MSDYYFSYGNNMSEETIRQRLGPEDARYIGRGRLRDYRIGFTTKTPEWDYQPVSDIISDKGFVVYGVVYEVGPEILDKMEPFEPTYVRSAVTIDLFPEALDLDSVKDPTLASDGRTVTATTFIVPDSKKEAEAAAHPPYLARVMEAALSRRLPHMYIQALESMRDPDNMVALRTRNRGQKKPLPIVQLSRLKKENLGLGSYALVSYEQSKRSCLAEVLIRDDLEDQGRVCAVDESLRIRLGLASREPALELYGACVSVSQVPREVSPKQWKSPRSLILWLDRVFHLESEKEICVIEERTLDLLGGEPGDYVKISAYFRDKNGQVRFGRISRRAMCGAAGKWAHRPDDEQYPSPGTIHLDEADRDKLGFPHVDSAVGFRDQIKGYPILVSLSVKHLFFKKLFLYVFSFLGLFTGLSLLSFRIMPVLLPPPRVQWAAQETGLAIGSSFVIALLIVFALIYFEMQRKVNP